MSQTIIKLYTLEALSKLLAINYSEMRRFAADYAAGRNEKFKDRAPGWKLVGIPKKAWFAYREDINIELVE